MPVHRRVELHLLLLVIVATAAVAAGLPVSPRATAAETVVYRVNAGGTGIAGTPEWTADTTGSPSPYVNASATGNRVFSTTSAIDTSDASVPPATPSALFQTERWDPPATPEMQWDFPVTPGMHQVRLYFAEIFSGAQSVGARVFDVSIEGNVVLNDYDVFADVGGFKGVVKTFTVTADSTLDIDFGHVTENPKVNAIEILAGAQSNPNQLGANPSNVAFGQVVVGQTSTLPVQLTNLGQSGDPNIVVDATTLSGTNPGQFSDGFNDATNVTLTPGQSTTINVTFAPTSTGAKSATLSVTHSGSNTPLAVPLSGEGVSSVPVGFGKSSLQGETSTAPTSLQFGPDGRLYVGQFNGVIKIYTISRNGPNSYSATATETINAVQSIANHNDDGSVNSSVNTRLLTGILVAGTASNPVIYAAHSDPRIGGGSSGADLNLDTNSSMISRLTWTGSSWQKVDLVRGLPRSEENHAANGMELDASTNTLYVAMGGNTNKGAPSNNFALLPEFALSAAILSVDLDAIGNTTYDLPTLNDENRSGNPDADDPFGGNDGKNQAKLVPGGPVQVYAPGFRNPYDVVITQSGQMYTIDNGGNAGWGDVPINEGTSGSCTNGVNEPGTSDQDALHLVTGSGYYGGHPNPTRANIANTFNTSIPQSPVSSGNAVECDYRKVGTAESTALTSFLSSTNGIAEYTATNFGGQMQGDLLAAGYVKNEIYRVQLNAAGTAVTSNSVLFTTVGSGPLDVVAQGNQGPFPGTIWVVDQKNGNIYAFEPNDFGGGVPTCTSADDPTLDEDADHYSNADEIDNGTDPCSAADVPPDWDGDRVSNLNDADDDNDGAPDTSDPFAIDPNNGTTTSLPVQFTWENNAPNPGGILNLGFTGLMTNGAANYEALYDENKMTGGGAAGVLTVDQVSEGDALGSLNTQEYGFQFGVDADPATTDTFTVHTRIMGPFNGLTPQDFQSMGLFIGTGSQNHYAKIVTAANGGVGGIQFVKEVNGTAGSARQATVSLPGPDWVDLYLTVDPDAATVQPQYSVTTGGSTGAIVNLGGPEPIPSSWFTDPSSGLAVGILSTSRGTAPVFPATWDLIEVVPQDIGDPDVLAHDTFTRTTSGGWGSAEIGGSWAVVAGSAGNFSVNGQKGLIAASGGNVQQMVHLPGVSVRDADAGVSITFPDAPSGSGNFFGYTLLRRQGGGANYRVGLFVTSGGKVFIRGQTSAGVALFPDVDTGLSFTAGDTFALRVEAVGASPTTIRAKAWEQGTPEPTGWNVATSNSASGLQQAGSVGLRTVTTGTSAATTLRFDDFLVQLAAGEPPPPPSAGEWQTRAPSGPNRQEVSYAQVGGKFYLAGGSTSSGTLTTHEAYDSSTNTWSTVAPLPEGLDHIQAVVVGGKIYYVGGLEAWPGPASAQVYIYDPATNTFTQGAAMPRPRGAGGVAVHQGKIYYAGGLSGGVAVPWFDVYDPITNTWTQLPNMPQARDHFHAQVVGGKFWVTGGRNTNINSTITSTIAYDFGTGTWQTGFAPLPTARGGFGAAVLGNEILVIGGEGGGNTFNTMEAYNTQTNTWRALANLPTARHGIQAAVCNGAVYIAAGGTSQGGGGPTDVHEVFFLNGPTTCSSVPPPSPTIFAQDSFTRTQSDSWGMADVGGGWSIVAGTSANFDVNGTAGTIAVPSGSQEQFAHLGPTSVRDVDAEVEVKLPGAPAGSNRFFGYLVLRRQSGGAHYRVGLYVTSSGGVFIRGQTGSGTSLFTDVNTGLAFSPGDTFVVRAQVIGTNPTIIQARAWKLGSVEPSTWAATGTDSTSGLQSAGSVGLRAVSTGAESTILAFDDLLVRQP